MLRPLWTKFLPQKIGGCKGYSFSHLKSKPKFPFTQNERPMPLCYRTISAPDKQIPPANKLGFIHKMESTLQIKAFDFALLKTRPFTGISAPTKSFDTVSSKSTHTNPSYSTDLQQKLQVDFLHFGTFIALKLY